ncbi:MAG: ribosome maturation factor RimM [Clostridia bacterium]|nr:ribosome maturation factor RimM [Clostridia bacterium]
MDLVIGKILKPQGIRGEVKVLPYTDGAEIFCDLKRVFIDGAEYKILNARAGEGLAYLALRGVPDRNAAELLRDKELTLPRDEAPEPEEGSYYIADLLESEIVTDTGKVLGILKDIRQAATDIYTLQTESGEVLFPAAKGVVLSIDIQNKKMTVSEKRFKEVAVL